MKVAIASDDGKTVGSHLGRARGFIIYETGPGQVRRRHYLENTFTGHARGLSGAGHEADRHGPILEALSGCKAVIAHGMGRRIRADLAAAGIEAYIVDETDPDVAIGEYLRGELVDHPERGCDHGR
jgi:predicted Fe-Mo cluster-binding NifX family protein